MNNTEYQLRIKAARGVHKISQADWEANPRIERLGVSDSWLRYGVVCNANDSTAQRLYIGFFQGENALIKPQRLTPRGHALMHSEPSDVPIITLENYSKWYDMWIIFPDGRHGAVPRSVLTNLMDDPYVKGLWRGDVFHPKLLLKVAAHYNGYVPETTVELAAGRWAMEVEGEYGLQLEDYKGGSK